MKIHCCLLLLGLVAVLSAEAQSPPLEAQPSSGGEPSGDQMIYLQSDPMPTFEGRTVVEFRQLLLESLEFPEPLFDRDTMIRVVVSMVVERDGSLSSVEFPSSPDKRIEAEVRRVVADFPAWTPGQIEGHPVRVKCVLPLAMSLQKAPEVPQEPAYAEQGASPQIMQISAEDLKGDTDVALPEKMPSFKGGDLNTFREWVRKRVVYPTEALDSRLSGRVVARFIINTDGSVSDVGIISSPSLLFSKEALRIIRRMPRWTPAEQDGKPVRVQFTFPLDFRCM